MTDFGYYKDLPYAVVAHGVVQARFRTWRDAEGFLDGLLISGFVIDTTPKPRVPDDARHITYRDDDGDRWYAEREGDLWRADDSVVYRTYDLPGVTPDTEFTVLDERSNT